MGMFDCEYKTYDSVIPSDKDVNTDYALGKRRIQIMENQSVGGELLEKGLTVMRIENETMQQMAIQKPRDEREVIRGALEELEIVPQYASKSFFSIPYKNDRGGVTMVEGPSIKAAMALGRRWGNCSNGARIVEDTEERIIVEGVFIDYQTGLRTLRQVSVSKTYWSKQLKKVIPLRADRLNMAIQAGMSKAVRNAILASLPVSFVESYTARAKQIASGGAEPTNGKKKEPIAKRLEKAKSKFQALGITHDQFEAYVNGLTLEDEESVIQHLIGLFNSIESGVAKIDDVFPVQEEKKEEKGQVSMEDVLKGDGK